MGNRKEPIVKARYLVSLLISALAFPAWAETGLSMLGKPAAVLAQLNPEERRAIRERWELASPEERVRMREEFLQRRMTSPDSLERRREAIERLRNTGAEERQSLRRDNPVGPERGEALPARPGRWNESGFGAGFERRRQEEGTDAGASGERPPFSSRPGMRPGDGARPGFMPLPRQP